MQILNLQGQFHHDAASPCGEALYSVKFQKKYFKSFLNQQIQLPHMFVIIIVKIKIGD